MFERFVKFFIENSRMNYTLFVLVCMLGAWSYMKTPKEIFPSFELDTIRITGSYSGTSINIMDKIVVREIEDEVKSLDGIKDMTSVITPGKFSIILELIEGTNKYNKADQVKDAISIVKSNFPSDMDEPKVSVVETNTRVAKISLGSEKLSRGDLIEVAKDVKTSLLTVKDISNIDIYGDSDLFFNVRLDESKIDSYGLDKSAVVSAVSSISYIFPLGKIEDSTKHAYISTYNGKKTAELMAQTILSINGKKIYLSDIALIEKRYEDAATLASFNTKPSITLSLNQLESGDAIAIVDSLNKRLEKLSKMYKDVEITLHDDRSDRIRDRLNIVISNIILGIILVGGLVALLINNRMAFIVGLGIPTSFVMAAVYFYLFGYTINMISLVGVLISLGIVVDDAIVVAEAIQQRIEKGMKPSLAAVEGTKEVALPIFMASLTTLFAFIPALMISGRLGMVIQLIPIALSSLLVASLIESFLFLPIHAAHTLKPHAKVRSWAIPNKIYSKIIHKLMTWRKTFLFLFFIIVPILIALQIKNSKFQMFPNFDSTTATINIKANVNTKVEDSYKIVQSIEKDLYDNKKKFHIKTISSIAGFRQDADRNTENYPYVMSINIEFNKLKAMNILDKYITPYLSFYYDEKGRTRDIKSKELSKRIRKFLKEKNYIDKYSLEEIFLAERRVGPIKSDIKLGLISNSNHTIFEAIKEIKEAINKVGFVKTLADSTSIGADEIKLKVNEYGEQLGVSEKLIGQTLANQYKSKKTATALDSENLLDIKVESMTKDSLDSLKTTKLTLPDSRVVMLGDVVEFQTVKSFEKVTKDFGERMFYVYVTLDRSKITAGEMLEKIKPVTDKLQKRDDLEIKFLGEKKKNQELKNDMMGAAGLALMLIMLSMLYLFNSFKDTFILMSVIPFSLMGVLVGHTFMDLNLSMPSLIGALGLAGVVINDGIIMMTYIKKSKNMDELFDQAAKRLRPIILTSVTTLIGLSSLIFFPTGQAVIFQPLAISLGFGLLWGTVLNLLYVPAFYAVLHRRRFASYIGE